MEQQNTIGIPWLLGQLKEIDSLEAEFTSQIGLSAYSPIRRETSEIVDLATDIIEILNDVSEEVDEWNEEKCTGSTNIDITRYRKSLTREILRVIKEEGSLGNIEDVLESLLRENNFHSKLKLTFSDSSKDSAKDGDISPCGTHWFSAEIDSSGNWKQNRKKVLTTKAVGVLRAFDDLANSSIRSPSIVGMFSQKSKSKSKELLTNQINSHEPEDSVDEDTSDVYLSKSPREIKMICHYLKNDIKSMGIVKSYECIRRLSERLDTSYQLYKAHVSNGGLGGLGGSTHQLLNGSFQEDLQKMSVIEIKKNNILSPHGSGDITDAIKKTEEWYQSIDTLKAGDITLFVNIANDSPYSRYFRNVSREQSLELLREQTSHEIRNFEARKSMMDLENRTKQCHIQNRIAAMKKTMEGVKEEYQWLYTFHEFLRDQSKELNICVDSDLADIDVLRENIRSTSIVDDVRGAIFPVDDPAVNSLNLNRHKQAKLHGNSLHGIASEICKVALDILQKKIIENTARLEVLYLGEERASRLYPEFLEKIVIHCSDGGFSPTSAVLETSRESHLPTKRAEYDYDNIPYHSSTRSKMKSIGIQCSMVDFCSCVRIDDYHFKIKEQQFGACGIDVIVDSHIWEVVKCRKSGGVHTQKERLINGNNALYSSSVDLTHLHRTCATVFLLRNTELVFVLGWTDSSTSSFPVEENPVFAPGISNMIFLEGNEIDKIHVTSVYVPALDLSVVGDILLEKLAKLREKRGDPLKFISRGVFNLLNIHSPEYTLHANDFVNTEGGIQNKISRGQSGRLESSDMNEPPHNDQPANRNREQVVTRKSRKTKTEKLEKIKGEVITMDKGSIGNSLTETIVDLNLDLLSLLAENLLKESVLCHYVHLTRMVVLNDLKTPLRPTKGLTPITQCQRTSQMNMHRSISKTICDMESPTHSLTGLHLRSTREEMNFLSKTRNLICIVAMVVLLRERPVEVSFYVTSIMESFPVPIFIGISSICSQGESSLRVPQKIFIISLRRLFASLLDTTSSIEENLIILARSLNPCKSNGNRAGTSSVGTTNDIVSGERPNTRVIITEKCTRIKSENVKDEIMKRLGNLIEDLMLAQYNQ